MSTSEKFIGMIHSFEELFVQQEAQKEIEAIISAIAHNSPILPLVENWHGSFSTIFAPFHAGTLLDDGSLLRDVPSLTPELRNFCELAGKIESLTDTWSTLDTEPSEGAKKELLPLLQDFLTKLPTKEQFQEWIEKSE